MPISRIWPVFSPVMDQGGTSQCVAYAGTKLLTSYPINNKPHMTPEVLYDETRRVDEWEGEDYDGTSVHGLMKILLREGYVREYVWATRHEQVLEHVMLKGPVVTGTDWYREMFKVDRYGYIMPEGQWDGGHAYVIIGASRSRKNPDGSIGAYRILNSWGPTWGEKGRAWMTFNHYAQLLRQNGEAAAAIEVLRHV